MSDNAKQAGDAVGWIQRGFALVDKLPEEESNAATADLKVAHDLPFFTTANSSVKISMLRTLGWRRLLILLNCALTSMAARAYFLAESYDRAEAVLDELISVLEAGNNASPSTIALFD